MKKYEISSETLAVLFIDKEKTKIVEKDSEFIVNYSTMDVINNSCKAFGSSYKGRFEGTKYLINLSHKAPIIIEEITGIIFFPTASPRNEDCSWISLNNLENYTKNKSKTIVRFSCGKSLNLDINFGIFDNQVLRATRLESVLNKKIKKSEN